MSSFNLWHWMLTKSKSIKDIKLTHTKPPRGFILLDGPLWFPINKEESLERWLYEHLNFSFFRTDVEYLSRHDHPIRLWIQKYLTEDLEEKEESLNSILEIWELKNREELDRILNDPSHKFHAALKDVIAAENQTTHIIDVNEKKFIRYLIPDIITSSFDPDFSIKSIPRVSFTQNHHYGIFKEADKTIIRELCPSDCQIFISNTALDYSTFLSRDKDLEIVESRMKRLIPNEKERELFRSTVSNIIWRHPHSIFPIFESDDVYSLDDWLEWIHDFFYPHLKLSSSNINQKIHVDGQLLIDPIKEEEWFESRYVFAIVVWSLKNST